MTTQPGSRPDEGDEVPLPRLCQTVLDTTDARPEQEQAGTWHG